MSVSILLVPAIIAAIAAASGAGAAGAVSARHMAGGSPGAPSRVQVATRMKDLTLLQYALEDVAATGVSATEDIVTAQFDDVRLTMTKTPEGIWEAHFESLSGKIVDETAVLGLVSQLDRAYAARVQSAVAEKIRLRADSAGLDLVSETIDEDQTVTMVLNVRQGG